MPPRLQSNYSSTVTLQGGPIVLRPVRATPCFFSLLIRLYQHWSDRSRQSRSRWRSVLELYVIDIGLSILHSYFDLFSLNTIHFIPLRWMMFWAKNNAGNFSASSSRKVVCAKLRIESTLTGVLRSRREEVILIRHGEWRSYHHHHHHHHHQQQQQQQQRRPSRTHCVSVRLTRHHGRQVASSIGGLVGVVGGRRYSRCCRRGHVRWRHRLISGVSGASWVVVVGTLELCRLMGATSCDILHVARHAVGPFRFHDRPRRSLSLCAHRLVCLSLTTETNLQHSPATLSLLCYMSLFTMINS